MTASPGYRVQAISSATRTLTPLRDVPQSVTVATRELIQDQLMTSVADVMRYIPGVGTHQGENNRDQVVIRGNNSSADFFLDGVRDDVQYYRDLYNLERVEALKGPNAMTFGRGGGGGVINRVTKEAVFQPLHEVSLQGGTYGRKRVAADIDQPLGDPRRLPSQRHVRELRQLPGPGRTSSATRVNPTLTFAASDRTKLTLGYEHLHDTRVADRGIPSFSGLPVDVDVATFFGNPDDSHVRANVDLASATVEHQCGRGHHPQPHPLRRLRPLLPELRSRARSPPDRSRVALSAYNNATARRNVFNQTDVTYALATGPVRHTLLAGAEIGRQLTDNFRNTGFFDGTATSISVPLASPTIETPVTFRQSATDADNHLRTNVGRRLRPGPDRALAQAPGAGRSALRPLRPPVPQQPQRRHAGPRGRPRLSARGRRLQAGDTRVRLRQLQRLLPAELRATSSPRSPTVTRAGRAGEVPELRGRA